MGKFSLLGIFVFFTLGCSPVDNNKLYEINAVDEKPNFPGGTQALGDFIDVNLTCSDSLQGKVYLELIIDKQGEIINAKILQGAKNRCDSSITAILMKSPKWSPALVNGEPVNAKMILPVRFKSN